jgi:hypothetical protein
VLKRRKHDIFISYASEDRERVQVLAEILKGQGWSVWWDRIILPGRRFDEEIQSALNQAKCVVVVWSKSSITSDLVKDEISEAVAKGLLVPAVIEHADIPLGYRRYQAADLSDWDGNKDHPEFQKMLSALDHIIANSATSRPRPASSAAHRHGRSIAGIALAMVLLIVVGGGAWYFYPRAQPPTHRLSVVVLPFTNLGNDPEREYFADAITNAFPNNAMAHFVRGEVLRVRKEFDAAIAEYEIAISIDHNLADAYARLGNVEIRVGRAEQAFAPLEHAIRLSPRDPRLNIWYFFLCHAHMHLGQDDAAIEWCHRSVAAGPFWIAFLDLASAYAWNGQDAEAHAAVAELLKLMPNYTVDRWRHEGWSDNPIYLVQDQRIIEGLRKAGLPEK